MGCGRELEPNGSGPHARKEPMRVADAILKSVGFVAEVVYADVHETDIDPQGTGFFVSIPAPRTGNRYHVFVTARHTAEGLQNKNIQFRVNNKNGGVMEMTMAADQWFLLGDPTVMSRFCHLTQHRRWILFPCALKSSLRKKRCARQKSA